MAHSEIKVWDPFVRVFHWTLVASFFIALLSGDDFTTLHTWAGYYILGLVLVRIVWGVVGTHYARFSEFVKSPRVAIDYMKNLLMLRAPRYVGHNPAGGLMIVALIGSLLITSTMGMIVLADEEGAGPMVGTLDYFPGWLLDVFEETHEAFAYFTLGLVVIHVAGVLVESVFHRENLVRAMLTGRKRKNG